MRIGRVAIAAGAVTLVHALQLAFGFLTTALIIGLLLYLGYLWLRNE